MSEHHVHLHLEPEEAGDYSLDDVGALLATLHELMRAQAIQLEGLTKTVLNLRRDQESFLARQPKLEGKPK